MAHFIAIFLAIACGLVYWHLWGGGRREREMQKEQSAERGRRAQAHGWHYDKYPQGDIRYHLYGKDAAGHEWCIEYDSDHSSSGSVPKLHFRIGAHATPRLEWRVVDATQFRSASSSAGRALFGAVLRLASAFSAAAQDHRLFLEESRNLGAGSARFQARFTLVGRAVATRHLIDDGIEKLILDWPAFKPSRSRLDKCFSAELGTEGLCVTLACDGPSFEVIEHLARLGQALAARLATGAQR